MTIYSESTCTIDKKEIAESRREHTVTEALQKLREFNKEFCADRTDAEILRVLKTDCIHTNFRKYWAVSF